MVKLLNTEFSVFPVQLLPDETVSLMFSLHLTSGTDYLAKEVSEKKGENIEHHFALPILGVTTMY